jgi:hypothetical protein
MPLAVSVALAEGGAPQCFAWSEKDFEGALQAAHLGRFPALPFACTGGPLLVHATTTEHALPPAQPAPLRVNSVWEESDNSGGSASAGDSKGEATSPPHRAVATAPVVATDPGVATEALRSGIMAMIQHMSAAQLPAAMSAMQQVPMLHQVLLQLSQLY